MRSGMLWAESRTLLLMALQQQMSYPTKPESESPSILRSGEEMRAEVIHQLATLLKAGLTLSEGLALLQRNSIPVSNGKRFCNRWRTKYEQGIALSNALLPWFGISAALSSDDPHG